MELNLFAKYKILIDTNKKEKDGIISIIKEKTGIIMSDKDIVIKKKEIRMYISSGERTMFIVRGGLTLFKKEGYKIILS